MEPSPNIAHQPVMQPTRDESGTSANIVQLNQPAGHLSAPVSPAKAPASNPASRAGGKLQRWATYSGDVHTGYVSAETNKEARKLVPAHATLVLVTTYFRHSVKGGGPWWRLYRKQPHPDAPWQLYFEHAGERYPTSLKTECLELAIETAKQTLTNHFEGHHDQFNASRARRGKFATFAEVFAIRHRLSIDARTTKAVDNYMWGTRFVLRLALGLKHPTDGDHLSTDTLNRQIGREFFAKARQHARTLKGQADQNRWFRTCNQAFNFTCALFAPRATESMIEDHQLTLPATIGDFRARLRLDKLDGGSNERFQKPSDDILRRTLEEWETMGRTPGYRIPGGSHRIVDGTRPRDFSPLSETARRNAFVAVGLSLVFGLRRSERMQVRGRHIAPHGGLHMLRAHSKEIPNKGNQEFTEIVALDPFWTIFKSVIDANQWWVGPEEYLLIERTKTPGQGGARTRGLIYTEGGRSDRTYWPHWDVSNWLRWLGWETQKTNHALRDYGASLITMKFGLGAAREWARHASQSTTESHYGHFVELAKMADPTNLQHITWAKA